MNLLKVTIQITSVSFFSRILGFIRDTIIVKTFGVNISTDAFFIVFKISNLVKNIFCEGIFSQIFVPILIKEKNRNNLVYIRNNISHILGLLIFFFIIIITIMLIFSSSIIKFISPGLAKNFDFLYLASLILKVIFPYIFFVSISFFASTILNIWNIFLIPTFSPVILNLSIILFSLFTNSFFCPSILALAWGILFGGIIQFFYQFPFLKKINMLVIPTIKSNSFYIIKINFKVIIISLSIFLQQIFSILNIVFSSFLFMGSISWIYYANRIIEFPCGIFTIILNTILFPLLIKNTFLKKNKNFNLIDWAFRICIFYSLPSTATLIILSKPIIVVLYQYGKFNEFDTIMTQSALISYSIGLTGFMSIKLLTMGFHSNDDFKTPIKISFISFLVNQFLNLIFIKFFHHSGIPLSLSIASFLNAILLFKKLYEKKIFIPNPGWNKYFIKIFFATITMSIFFLIVNFFIHPTWEIGNIVIKILKLIFLCILGGIIYILVLIIIGFKLSFLKIKK